METTETDVTPIPQPELILNFEAQSYLREAGKWANFLAIIGFIICGIILIIAFFAGSMFTIMSKMMPNGNNIPAGVGGFVTVFYILFDVLYFFFAYYLYQFADKIKKGIVFTDNAHVTAAFNKLKSFFKLWGIVTIVVLCLYALIFIISIIAGLGAASFMHR
jgi:Ca2+/Na+ antiporter